MTDREALKLALEALQEPHPGVRTGLGAALKYYEKIKNATIAIKEALAQLAQEPVEWLTGCPECGMDSGCDCDSGTCNPPQRPWVGLTVDELIDLEHKHLRHENLTCAIEAKLKEKNT
jgi:hypothetical protein